MGGRSCFITSGAFGDTLIHSPPWFWTSPNCPDCSVCPDCPDRPHCLECSDCLVCPDKLGCNWLNLTKVDAQKTCIILFLFIYFVYAGPGNAASKPTNE